MSTTDVEASVVRTWQTAGPILDQLRRKGLRTMTDQMALEAVLDLLDLVTIAPPKTGMSGLIEQQRYFALARR